MSVIDPGRYEGRVKAALPTTTHTKRDRKERRDANTLSTKGTDERDARRAGHTARVITYGV